MQTTFRSFCALILCIVPVCVDARAKDIEARDAAICDRAARVAAREIGTPLSVLRAITRVETGRSHHGKVEPWPWTVNMEGKGAWFETEDAARAYVFKHFKRGARSFDVGCFQINYKWHGQAFASIDEMFDPLENAIYAARYLRDLYQEFGDWSAAAGAYHSRTPEYAKKYRARFDRHLARVADEPLQASPLNAPLTRATDQPARHNSYPLLQSTGGRVVLGSLVPLVDTGDDSHAESGLFADRPGWGS